MDQLNKFNNNYNNMESDFANLPYNLKLQIKFFAELTSSHNYEYRTFQMPDALNPASARDVLVTLFGTNLYAYIDKYIFNVNDLIHCISTNKQYIIKSINVNDNELYAYQPGTPYNIEKLKINDCVKVIIDTYKTDYNPGDIAYNKEKQKYVLINEVFDNIKANVLGVTDIYSQYSYDEYLYNLEPVKTYKHNDNKCDNKELDLSKLLKIGYIIYSTALGYAKVTKISYDEIVICKLNDNICLSIDFYGRLVPDGECIVWPNKDTRAW